MDAVTLQVMVGADWDGAKKVKVTSPSQSSSPDAGQSSGQDPAANSGTATQKLCK